MNRTNPLRSAPLRLATRASPLALRQAQMVADELTRRFNNLSVHIIPFSTRGDEITDRPLAQIGGKALFVKRLQQAIKNNEADFAVHSLKDMEALPAPGFTLAAVGFAAAHHDVLIHPTTPAPPATAAQPLQTLPPGAKVGTCSPRRAALIRRYAPAVKIVPMRGNLQTRLEKLQRGEADALILAAAGLQRMQPPASTTPAILDLSALSITPLPPAQFIPAPGQGLLALECAAANTPLRALLAEINDSNLMQRAIAERAFAAAMQGDCHTAVGALAAVIKQQNHTAIQLTAFYAPPGEGAAAFHQTTVTAQTPQAAAQKAATAITRLL